MGERGLASPLWPSRGAWSASAAAVSEPVGLLEVGQEPVSERVDEAVGVAVSEDLGSFGGAGQVLVPVLVGGRPAHRARGRRRWPGVPFLGLRCGCPLPSGGSLAPVVRDLSLVEGTGEGRCCSRTDSRLRPLPSSSLGSSSTGTGGSVAAGGGRAAPALAGAAGGPGDDRAAAPQRAVDVLVGLGEVPGPVGGAGADGGGMGVAQELGHFPRDQLLVLVGAAVTSRSRGGARPQPAGPTLTHWGRAARCLPGPRLPAEPRGRRPRRAGAERPLPADH